LNLTTVAQNRKARYNYLFLELFESGIELKGSELFLINSHFSKYSNSSYMNHEETRPRKLLLNKKRTWEREKKRYK